MNTKKADFWEQISFTYGPWIIMSMGLLILIGAILNWDWVLEGDGHVFNIAWVSNVFGRTIARIIMGILGGSLFLVGIWYLF